MKTRLTLAMLVIAVATLFAQQAATDGVTIADVRSYYFYGVDFSHCTVTGAAETEPEFVDAFCRINELFYTEADKYSLRRFNRQVLDINIEQTNERNMKAADFIRFTTKKTTFSNPYIQSLIKDIDIPYREGYGMILLCECLDKTSDFGYYTIVFFDNATRRVIHTQHVMGRSGGFGLRNYWANSVHEVLKKRYRF